MPNYRRLFIPGGSYFFTLTLADRRTDYLVRYIELLRASWADVESRWPFEAPAIVILPDHLHMLMNLPEDDRNFPTRIRLLKSGFTRRLPAELKSKGRKGGRNIWQARYWEHAIRDDKDYEAHFNYIHFNPIKHGLVSTVDQWPHSTWHRYNDQKNSPLDINLDVGER